MVQSPPYPTAPHGRWSRRTLDLRSGRRARFRAHGPLERFTTAGLAAQKKSLHAAERDTERVKALRGDFLEAVQAEDFTRFRFVDGTGVNLMYRRHYGRAPGGQRVDQAVPLHNGPMSHSSPR